MMVKLLHWIGVIDLIICFTHIILVEYVTNTHFFNKESWGCFQSLVKTNLLPFYNWIS